MFQNEAVLGFLDSTDLSGQNLVITSTRVIILKNRTARIGGIIGVILAVILVYLLGIIVGFIIGLGIVAVILKLTSKPKDYRKVSIESLLSLDHEEINYPQIEKVELKKNKVKFFYVVQGERRKKKQWQINGALYQQNLDLLNKVLFDKLIIK
jgi:hypothetical protein